MPINQSIKYDLLYFVLYFVDLAMVSEVENNLAS